jgi:hypothetical protein
VPAVFVSPRIKPGTILHRQFDHCSIVATVRKLFCRDKTPFNWREAQASSFDDVLNLAENEVRTDTVVVPPPVVSTGTIPLKRDLVLSATDREAVAAAMTAAGLTPGAHIAAAPFTTASAPPVRPPQVPKPTDLMILMAQAMQHTLQLMGVSARRKVNQIQSAQDAADYLAEAAALIQQKAKGATP